MGNCYAAGPNEILVVSGGCCARDTKKYSTGGWRWGWAGLSTAKKLSLGLMTVHVTCRNVSTQDGTLLTVTGLAQMKVFALREYKGDLTRIACDTWIGKSKSEVETVQKEKIEQQLQTVIGKFTSEQIRQDRETFASDAFVAAAQEVGKRGIQVLHFLVKDVVECKS